MFEMAERYVTKSNSHFEIVGNYMSPCSDAYKKASLAPAHHRINSKDIQARSYTNDRADDSFEM